MTFRTKSTRTGRFREVSASAALAVALIILSGVGMVPVAHAAPTLVGQADGGGTGTSYTLTLRA